jgi:hypothetical protein
LAFPPTMIIITLAITLINRQFWFRYKEYPQGGLEPLFEL